MTVLTSTSKSKRPRIVPIVPNLRGILLDVFERAEEGVVLPGVLEGDEATANIKAPQRHPLVDIVLHGLRRFLWRKGDEGTIDRWGPDGISALALKASNRTSRLQSGYLYHYALAMVLGVAVFALFLMFYSSKWFEGGFAGA